MISPVVQEQPTGCAIACAAALAGMSYASAQRAAAAIGVSASDPSLWSDTAPLRKLLTALGVRAQPGEQAFACWEALPDRALLAIKWKRRRDASWWHWVVFVRENGRARVLDPGAHLKSNVRTDFGRMRPRWYIELQH